MKRLALSMTLLLIAAPANAAIVTSEYKVEKYSTVTDPRAISFDASGNLFSGRDNIGSGGGFGDAVQIQRIAADLTVSSFGPVISDPGLLIVGLTGAITGIENSVIVGGSGGSGTNLSVIHPDESATELLSTSLLVDVNGLAINSLGQLVIGDGLGLSLYSGTTLTRLTLLPGIAVDDIGVDSSDNIFATTTDNTLKIFNASGNLINNSFVSDRYLRFAFGRGGAFGDDIYGVDQLTGELVHVSDSGIVDVIGSGFGNSFVTFGNDGALYISELDNDRILRVDAVPEPTSVAIWFLMSVAGFATHRRNRNKRNSQVPS